MALSEWLIPKPSLSAQAQLRHSVDTLRKHGPTEAHATTELACSLMHQLMLKDTLLRQAIHHISALELGELLAQRPKRNRALDCILRWLPRK
jgi:hypothetical protein